MTRYTVADYRLFDADGHNFLFLPALCAVFELAAEAKEMLDRGRSLGNFTREAMLSGLTGPAEENRDFFEELVLRHVIVKENKQTPSPAYPAACHAERLLQTLVLQVTDACNMGCDYCYCRKDPGSLNPEKKMTTATACRSVDFLLARSGGLSTLTLVFFGGEPLLNFDLISETIDYARKKASRIDKKIEFAVTTNGTLLTDRVADVLQEKGISVTVSMDGTPENHDRHRRFLDGSPSYEAISPNVKDFLHKMAKTPVAARVTVTEETTDIQNTLRHLLDMGFAEVGFAPVTTHNRRFQLGEEGMASLLHRFSDLSDQFLDFAGRDELLGFTNLIDLLVLIHEGEVKQIPCGAGLGLFCVDSEGKLYLCQRLVGDINAHMGDIDKGIDSQKSAAFRSEVDRDRKTFCAACWARSLCAGGCYQEALVREGSLSAPNRHYCRWIKDWIDIGLGVYARLAATRPEYLDRLARLRGR